MATATLEKDQAAELCQALEEVNLAENNSCPTEVNIQAVSNEALAVGDTSEAEDLCLEVHWRQMEAELKKNETEEKQDSGDAPSSFGAGDGAELQKSTPSPILVQEEEITDKFQMPTLKTFQADLASIKTSKIVVVYPLSEDNLTNPQLTQIRTSEHCIEYRIRHIRQGMDSATCFLSLYFTSKASAEVVVEQLKTAFPEQQVEFASQESQVNKMIAAWSSNQKPNALLPHCTLLIKNIGNTVTVDKLKELFPTAEDVVLPREKQDGKGPLRNKGYAYAVFLSPESANLAAESCVKEKPELEGRPLKVLKYFEPKSKPEGLLTLVERRLVLRQGAKASSMVEKKKNGEEVKGVDAWKKKLQTCLKLIKRDNELRQELGLPTPSYDDLCNAKDLPVLDSKKSQQMMERLGIFFAKSTDKANGSASLHKGTMAASASKTVKAQRTWYQDKRNKRPIHRPGMGRGILGTPTTMHGNVGGLLGNGPAMLQGMYGQHTGPFNSGYSRFNYKGQYRNYPGNQRDLANSVGLLVNLSQMLAQQVQHQQQFGQQQRPTGTQNMYNHGDYNRGGGKFGQQSSDRSLGATGAHYEGYGNSGPYHPNRPFYSGY